MRSITSALALMLVIVTFSGCLGIFEDEEAFADENGEETVNGTEETQGDEEVSAQEEDGGDGGPQPLPARLNGTVLTTENETVAEVNITLEPVDNGEADDASNVTVHTAATDDEGNYLFEQVPAGTYLFAVNATCCVAFNETITLEAGENKTLDLQLELLQTEPAPEGGEASGGATGASLVLSSRASFTLENGEHEQLELIPESDDPLAQQGQSYTFRLYLPNGDEENYSGTNGEPIYTESVMEGEYEITIWPVVAGDISYTIDWCAFSSTHCSEV
jgi:hypothetical protein